MKRTMYSVLLWLALVGTVVPWVYPASWAEPLTTIRPNGTLAPSLLPDNAPHPATTQQPLQGARPVPAFAEGGSGVAVPNAFTQLYPITRQTPASPPETNLEVAPTAVEPEAPSLPDAPGTEASATSVAETSETRNIDIESDTLVYDDVLKAYILTGNVRMMVEDQNAVLLSDKVTYQPDADIVVAEGNVDLTKDGQTTKAAFARIRLNGKTALVTSPNTSLGFIRLRARDALIRPELSHFKDGAVIIVPRQAIQGARLSGGARFVGGNEVNGLVIQNGYTPHNINSKQTQRFIDADNLNANPAAEAQQFVRTLANRGVDISELELNPVVDDPAKENAFLRLVVKNVNIQQYPDDYFMIDLKSPRIKHGEKSVLPLPNLDIGFDRTNGRVDYLGPEAGFNRDLGGLYYNPGFDVKLGPGALKLSPLFSYGQTIDRSEASINIRDPEFGYGVMSSYRTDRLNLMAARNFRNDYNVLSGIVNIIPGQKNTRLIASQNAFAGSNLFTQERPSWGVRVEDNRTLFGDKLFALNMSHSAGVFKDDFFPFNSAEPFVTPQSLDPLTAGRLQQQLNLFNTRPLFKIGNNLELGFNAQASNAFYTNDEYLSVLRAGPTANFFIGDVFMSQAAYRFGVISGRSPFVFDSFFLGKETLTLNNALRLGPYALVGLRQDFNLDNDNARNDALVGNTVYLSVGSRNVKFMVGYDTIFRITRFGVSYYPNTSEAEIEFDNGYLMNAIQPLDPGQMSAFRRWRERSSKKRQGSQS